MSDDTEQHHQHETVLGLCGCGHPADVSAFVIDCLKQFADCEVCSPDEKVGGVRRLVMDRPDAAAELIAQFLDSRGLLHHGGSIYGAWINDAGRKFIETGPITDG